MQGPEPEYQTAQNTKLSKKTILNWIEVHFSSGHYFFFNRWGNIIVILMVLYLFLWDLNTLLMYAFIQQIFHWTPTVHMQINRDAKIIRWGLLRSSLSHRDDTHCIREDQRDYAAVTKNPDISLAEDSKGSCSCSVYIVGQQESNWWSHYHV